MTAGVPAPPYAPVAPPRSIPVFAVAGVAALGAAALLIGGSFLPYMGITSLEDGMKGFSQHISGWVYSSEPPDLDDRSGHPAHWGIPLSVVGSALLVAAFLALIAASGRATAAMRSAARMTSTVATGGAIVAVWMIGLHALSAIDNNESEDADSRFRVVIAVEAGFWVLLIGVGLALLATVVIWVAARSAQDSAYFAPPWQPGPPSGSGGVAVAPGVQMYLEPATPPSGIALPPPASGSQPFSPQPFSSQPAPPPPAPYQSPFAPAENKTTGTSANEESTDPDGEQRSPFAPPK